MPDLSDQLVDFINMRLPRLRAMKVSPRIDADTPLFETGLIDSLGILHLIAFVEAAINTRIPTRLIVMKNFRTVRSICQTFAPQLLQEVHHA